MRFGIFENSFIKAPQGRLSESPSLLRVEERTTSARYSVLGVPVDAVQIPEVISRVEEWIANRSATRFIAVTGMHGIVEAQHDLSFMEVLSNADLVVPDGMPLIWLGRKRGHALKRRVYGPELTERFCCATQGKYRHFFYGGALGVADSLAALLHRKTGARIVGTCSPPYRPLTSREDEEIVSLINRASADIVWVGLSTPKQERWMFEHRKSLHVPALVGVGAAFDLLTGRVRQAPSWMRERGLEWMFRLWQEPRRLSRRYVIYGSEFAWKASLEAVRVKRF